MLNKLGRPALVGGMLMLGFAIMQTLVWCLIRLIGDRLSAETLFFFRNLIGAAFVLPMLIRTKGALLKTKRPAAHGLRALAALVGGLSLFVALVRAPLSFVVAMTFLAPVMAGIFNIVVERQPMARSHIAALLIALAGMLIMLRPSAPVSVIGSAAALTAAIATAGAYIMARRLSETEPVKRIFSWIFVILLVPSGAIASTNWTMPHPEELVLVIFMGVGFSAAQFLLARAFAAAPAGVVLPLDFTRLLFAFAAGTVFFADPFDLASGFGGTLIFAAALLVTLAPDAMRKMAQTRNKR
jgi:drug/metabolite transporter (DMT)-like permease